MNVQCDVYLFVLDFFDVVQYFMMVFESDIVEVFIFYSFMVCGYFSLYGQIYFYEFYFDVIQLVCGFYGEMCIGVDMEGYLCCSIWGLKWNQMFEFGGFVLSDDVNVCVNIQVMLQSDFNLYQYWELEDNGQSIDFIVWYYCLLCG